MGTKCFHQNHYCFQKTWKNTNTLCSRFSKLKQTKPNKLEQKVTISFNLRSKVLEIYLTLVNLYCLQTNSNSLHIVPRKNWNTLYWFLLAASNLIHPPRILCNLSPSKVEQPLQGKESQKRSNHTGNQFKNSFHMKDSHYCF